MLLGQRKLAGQPLPADKKFINSGGRKIGFLTPTFRKFRPGGKSGLPVSDYFPRVRAHADKLGTLFTTVEDGFARVERKDLRVVIVDGAPDAETADKAAAAAWGKK